AQPPLRRAAAGGGRAPAAAPPAPARTPRSRRRGRRRGRVRDRLPLGPARALARSGLVPHRRAQGLGPGYELRGQPAPLSALLRPADPEPARLAGPARAARVDRAAPRAPAPRRTAL